jgi:hypothetical protein
VSRVKLLPHYKMAISASHSGVRPNQASVARKIYVILKPTKGLASLRMAGLRTAVPLPPCVVLVAKLARDNLLAATVD